MSSPYQALDNTTAYPEGQPAPAVGGVVPQAAAVGGPAVGPAVQQMPHPGYHAISMPVGPQPVVMAPIAAYPLQFVMNPGVLMNMPVYVSPFFRGLLIFVLCVWTAVFTMNLFLFLDDTTLIWLWVWYPCIMLVYIFALWYKLPTRCEITSVGVTVFTRGTAYSLPFARMSSIEVVRSTWCWTGAACSFPRTKFTSTENGVFFRSDDCATSIGFSPLDINQFLLALQQTPANGKIMYS